MTLKEKFEKATDGWIVANKCVEVADEFAIGFLEFTESTYSFGNIIGKWYLHENTSKEYTTKELLEIYKKEKGL
jgi:hypothetical protein